MERDDLRAVAFRKAVQGCDAEGLEALFEEHPALREAVDAQWFSFGTTALVDAVGRCDRDFIDALIDFGADLDARSDWPNGPYTALHRLVDGATPESLEVADYLAARGATVDLHAAAGMGRAARIEEILDEEPSRINEPGPDGAAPLHLAKDAQIAELLIDRGANVDQRCVDHRSTPAMWAAAGRIDVVRVLLAHGATRDLFLAALLNDVDMARSILDEDPSAIHVRVRFGQSHRHLGHGDKYVWTLGGAERPVELARRRGSQEVYELLLARSEPAVRLVQASHRADLAAMQGILDEHPDLIATKAGIHAEDVAATTCQALIAGVEGASYLLARGADPNARDDGAGATPLHHAAWRNDVELARLLLAHGADPSLHDRDHEATPQGWAEHAGNDRLASFLQSQSDRTK